MAVDLDFSAAITTATGWLVLENAAGGYELQSDSFAEEAVTWRQREISAEWVEGSFTVSAVRNNIVVPVSVWVTGLTPLQCSQRRRVLETAFGQLRYTLRIQWGTNVEYLNCMPAPYTKTCSGPLMMANEVLLTAQVPSLPTRVLATGTALTDPFGA